MYTAASKVSAVLADEELTLAGPGGHITINANGIEIVGLQVTIKSHRIEMKRGYSRCMRKSQPRIRSS